MEINSSLLNSKSMRFVKQSLIDVSKIDNKEKFRVKLVNYIDDSSTAEEDEFFFEMLSFLRFLKPSSKSIAFTTPNKLIYMNAPTGGNVGESVRKWDFIYCHECLHQLWDTFGVKEQIEKAGIEYNHKLLNIASDCVINEYLRDKRKKEHFENGIYPEVLEKEFGVKYDYRNDTQFSLYLKLLEQKNKLNEFEKNNPGMIDDDMPKEKLKPKSTEKVKTPPAPPGPSEKHSKDYIKGWKDAIKDTVGKKVDPLDKDYKEKNTGNNEYDKGYNDCMNDIIKGLTDGIQLGDSSSNAGGSGDLPQIPWDTDNEEQSSSSSSSDSSEDSDDSDNSDNDDLDNTPNDSSSAQDAADEAKEAAEKAQKAADEAKKAPEKSQNEEDKEAAKKTQEAADEAKKAADKAQEAADEAKEAAENGDKKTEEKAAKKAKEEAKKAKAASDKASNEAGNGDDETELVETEADLEQIRKNAEAIIEKYKNRIVGDFGSFIKKCKSSVALKKDGLGVNNQRGMASWNEKLNANVNAFVKKKIFQKKRQFERTYSRVKRGSGFIEFGKPIEPGRKVREQKLTINACFYVDCSGSMSGDRLENATKAIYRISEGLKKHFTKDKIVEDVVFKLVAWDTNFYDVKWGNKIHPKGGTMSLEDLVEGVIDKSADYLINIIITDGEFSNSSASKIEKLLSNNIEGMFAFVINNSNCTLVKNIAKKYTDKIFYIEASSDFELK